MKIVGIILLACLFAFSEARPDRSKKDNQRERDMEDNLLQLLRQRMMDTDEDEENEDENDMEENEQEQEQKQMKEKEVGKKEKTVADATPVKKADTAEKKKAAADVQKKDAVKDTKAKTDARKKYTNDVVDRVLAYMDSKNEFSDEDALILTKHMFEAISDIAQMKIE